MKKSFIRFGASVLILLLSFGIHAQNITIIPSSAFGTSTPTSPVSVCQCDTLGISANPSNNVAKPILKYNISAPGFSALSDLYFELASPNNSWSGADTLELFELTRANDLSPVDTFAVGEKWAKLIIPCNAPLGAGTMRIIINDGTNNISDTAYLLINRLPDLPVIKNITGGFPNAYTPTTPDWGFCEGDSVILEVEQQPGASYQWLINGSPILPVENDTLLVVKASGNYGVRVDFGACARDSKDTTIRSITVPTMVTNKSLPPAVRQIDNPIPGNFSPTDSIMFCYGGSAVLEGNAPLPATGLTFSYQWITDSVDPFNVTHYYKTDTADTLQSLTVDTTGRYYVVINDGMCQDTSAPYYVFTDTLPSTQIASENYDGAQIGPLMVTQDICMTDSVRLSSTNTQPNWTYQWQRLNTSTNLWESLPNAANPNFMGATNSIIVVDLDILPVQPLSFYRLRTRTVTPFAESTVCEFFSQQVRVRYLAPYTIDYTPQPWVTLVGNDSVSLCEADSVQLTAPTTPGQLVTNGLNYSYQWLTDSLDTAGVPIKVPIAGAIARTFYTNTTGKYYIALDDGICIDTSAAFNVFADTVPSTTIIDTILPPPAPPTKNNRLLCLTDSVVLVARSALVPFLRYQWQQYQSSTGTWVNLPNDTLPGILVDTSYREPGEDTAYFRVNLSYVNTFGLPGCPFTTDSLEVVFFDPPTLSIFPSDSLGLCVGDSVLIIAQGNSQSYLWNTGANTPAITVSQPGTYTVTGTGVNGCTTTRSVKVDPITTTANAGPDITTTSGTSVQLSGSGGTAYRWYANKPIAWSDFLSQNVTVSYTLPDGVRSDTVIIYLEVTNTAGCVDTDSLTLIVTIDEDPGVSLIDRAYNYFTPNSDGMNDVWDITSIVSEYDVCRIDVMNRWGSIIFNQEVFNGIWDGRNNGGQDLPDGTYYYILSCDGKVILKNAVTLIRTK